MNFIVVLNDPRSKFLEKKKKKKNPIHFNVLKGKPNVLLYIYPNNYYALIKKKYMKIQTQIG
jgi:hypothetical protein